MGGSLPREFEGWHKGKKGRRFLNNFVLWFMSNVEQIFRELSVPADFEKSPVRDMANDLIERLSPLMAATQSETQSARERDAIVSNWNK